MAAVDFTEWAIPDLVITLGGHEYRLAPPSVAQARPMLAVVAEAEVRLGLAKGPLPDELAQVVAELADVPLSEIGIPDAGVREQMDAAGLPRATIDRVAYYAMFHWVRGKERADLLATALWAPRDQDATAEDAPAPKA